MCWMAAVPIAMMAVQGVSSSISGQKATAAQIKAGRGQQVEMIKQMNYTDANLKLKERDLLDTTVNEMTQQNMNRVRNMGTIRAAIGEGMIEGNSMDRVMRVTEGDYLREQQGLTENYNRDYSVILGDRIANREQTVSQIKHMQKAEPKLRSRLEMALDPLALVTAKGAEAYSAGAFDSKPKGSTQTKKTK